MMISVLSGQKNPELKSSSFEFDKEVYNKISAGNLLDLFGGKYRYFFNLKTSGWCLNFDKMRNFKCFFYDRQVGRPFTGAT